MEKDYVTPVLSRFVAQLAIPVITKVLKMKQPGELNMSSCCLNELLGTGDAYTVGKLSL